jgi:hypothetical protein
MNKNAGLKRPNFDTAHLKCMPLLKSRIPLLLQQRRPTVIEQFQYLNPINFPLTPN